MTDQPRYKFLFNPYRKDLILSIDGGGMRGIVALAILCWLEEQTGKPAYELFKLVGGTSTGALICAGLGLGMSAREMMDDIYKDRLPRAFRKIKRFRWLRFLFSGLRHMYAYKPFIDALGPYSEGKRMADIDKPAILLTTKDMRTSNTYYITNRGPGAPMFAHWPLAGAVASSVAAPLFFPPVGGNLVDGGVGSYGNPCLAVSVEAIEYLEMRAENVIHLSLGNGYFSNEVEEGAGAGFWLKSWIEYLIFKGMDDAALQQVFMARAIYAQMDFRRYNPLLSRESVEHNLGIDCGDVDPSTLALDSNGQDEVELMEQIGRAYAAKIDWMKEGALPWNTIGGRAAPGFADSDWENSPFSAQALLK
ncbi:MAG: patatin-like phospholipase family protein [Chloroflexi bacterium]|nr:patatin-like phospholipase family protein [Chloroflexota bacterium]